MSGTRLRPVVTKEFRALLPAWIASAVAIGAAVLSGPRSHDMGLIAYGFGSVALGAQSIGHEFTHRTLTLLLSQPSSRRRLLLTKLAVLAAMLLALAAFARLALLKPGDSYWMIASLLNGLFVAPLLTMACRTPVAGVVFTGAAPFWMLLIGRYVGGDVLWASTLALSAAAAVAGWRLFMRLEAIDGRGPDVDLPWMRRRTITTADATADSARARHPVWLLVKKELHLQQMTFAVAGLWVVIWTAVFALGPLVPELPEFPLAGVGILYGALLAVLIGSLASAEERQNGTLEWQLLLPMATWKQWAVKVGTVLVLTAVLSYAFPLALAAGRVGVMGWHAGAIVMLTIGSLYISSLSRTTVRALMVSGGVLLALGQLGLYVAGAYPGAVSWQAAPLAAAVTLMLWFAMENHRLAEHSTVRVAWQLMWMTGTLALGVAVASAMR